MFEYSPFICARPRRALRPDHDRGGLRGRSAPWRVAALTCLMLMMSGLVAVTPALAESTYSGKVQLSDGTPTPNARVILRTLMDPDVPIDYPDKVLDQTQADIYGNYTLTIPVTPDLVAAANENGGSLNLGVHAVYAVAGLGDTYVAFEGLQGRTAMLSEDGSSWTVYVDEEDDQPLVLQSTEAMALPATTASTSFSTTSTELGCYYKTEIVRTEYPRAVIGEYHTKRDVAGRFTYGRRADSHLGVGVSTNNIAWSQNGTVHIGNLKDSATGVDRGPNWAKKLLSTFKTVKERQNVYCPGYSNTNYWSIYSTRWQHDIYVGGDVSDQDTLAAKDAAVSKGFASHYPTNSFASRSTQRAKRYSAGLSVMGASLSARSGFSTYVTQTWNFGNGVAHHWLFNPTKHWTESRVVNSY